MSLLFLNTGSEAWSEATATYDFIDRLTYISPQKYNIHTLNIKGGNKQNRFELIIITSIQNPKYIYGKLGDEPRKQWMRRMEILHMTDNTNDESDTDSIDIDGLF